jgi:CcmD family protein
MSENLLFVGAAFTVTWAVLLGYLMHLRTTRRRAQAMFEAATAPGVR